MTPGPGIEPGTHWWKASALTTAPTLLPKIYVCYFDWRTFKLDAFNPDLIAAAASEPEANERGSSLISRRLPYRGFQSLFLTKRKELWLCANGRFRMLSGIPQGIVVMREWEHLGCAAYQSHV